MLTNHLLWSNSDNEATCVAFTPCTTRLLTVMKSGEIELRELHSDEKVAVCAFMSGVCGDRGVVGKFLTRDGDNACVSKVLSFLIC